MGSKVKTVNFLFSRNRCPADLMGADKIYSKFKILINMYYVYIASVEDFNGLNPKKNVR